MKIVYKFVLITFFAFSVHSHHYNGWNYGPYGSIVQSQPLWEWHTYGQEYDSEYDDQEWYNKGHNGNINPPAHCAHDNYDEHVLQPNQDWNYFKQANEQDSNSNQDWNQPNQGKEQNFNPNQPVDYFQPNPGNEQNLTPAISTNPPETIKPTPEFKSPNATGDNREAGQNQQALPAAPMYNATHNPCTRKVAPKPNFKKAGRRISEEKCLEFIWDIKAREETARNEQDCSKYESKSVTYVYGGRPAEPGEFPHMVALGWKAVEEGYIFKCGGSIIHPKFVVTAGHCTKSKRDPRTTSQVPEIVRYGAKDLQNQKPLTIYPLDINITNIIRHPNYMPLRQYFDIALLELEKNIPSFDQNVQAACLWSNLNTDNIGKVSTSGWGATETSGKQTVTELRVGDLDLIKDDVCDNLLRPMCKARMWCGLESHQICAGKLAGGVDACQGDSGGPLQVQINLHPSIKGKIYYLLGVTSFGFGCALPNSPGVYTKISAVIDWIEQNVWPN